MPCKKGAAMLSIIQEWEMCDPENCSNSPMVTEVEFKSIILITRDFHKEGKNDENFTKKGLAFHRAA